MQYGMGRPLCPALRGPEGAVLPLPTAIARRRLAANSLADGAVIVGRIAEAQVLLAPYAPLDSI